MSETSQEQENFLPPIQIQTSTPYAKLRELSKENKIPPEFIDFRIQSILTKYTNEQNSEPVFVGEDDLKIFDDNDFFLDPTLNIEQTYNVEFFDIRINHAPKLPKISIGVNPLITRIVATVHKSNECVYEPNYEQKLFDYIAKQLVKAQILIGIRMNKTKEELSKIASVLRINDAIDQDYVLNVVSGINPIKAVDAKTIYYYKNKLDGLKKDGKIDYASRGFLFGVSDGEVIIEQKKSQSGRDGRDVRGKFIKTPEPKEDGIVEINITENIERKEEEDGVKFIAKKAGYVIENKGTFDIEERLEINEVNFKTTGSIQAGVDTNVTLVVKETDLIKDAIGTGVIVEADEVQVKGNIGANAIIKANDVVVGGQTHQKAKIYAQNANIAIHIGYVEAENVEIERLEGGSVLAKKVKLKSVVGGSITAQNIQIETLGSNCTITASHLVEVKYLRGTNNRFIIDASKMKDRTDEVDEQLEKIEELKCELARLPKKLEAKKTVIDENKSSIYTIKAKVEELAKAKVIPPVTFMKKLKEYQELVSEYNGLLKEFKVKKEQMNDLKSELEMMQNGIFSAKIINRGNWIELNEIKFVLVDPPQNITYSTKQNETARVISLEKIENFDGNVEYKIKKSNQLEDFENITF
ncbi:MAG: FapA family protein [Campylobacter sp.]|nr:FapA family protein [Campylobacter sp.]